MIQPPTSSLVRRCLPLLAATATVYFLGWTLLMLPHLDESISLLRFLTALPPVLLWELDLRQRRLHQ